MKFPYAYSLECQVDILQMYREVLAQNPQTVREMRALETALREQAGVDNVSGVYRLLESAQLELLLAEFMSLSLAREHLRLLIERLPEP